MWKDKVDKKTRFLQLIFISRYYAEITMIIGMFLILFFLVKKYI